MTSCYSWSQEKVEKLPRISFADELVSSDWGFYGHYFASDKYKKELRANEKEKIIDRAEYTLSNGNKVYVKMRLFRNKKGFIDEEFLSDADVEVTTYLGTKQVKTGNKIKVPNPDCNPNGLKKISTSTPLLFEIDYSK